jgi:hypothetical protein
VAGEAASFAAQQVDDDVGHPIGMHGRSTTSDTALTVMSRSHFEGERSGEGSVAVAVAPEVP